MCDLYSIRTQPRGPRPQVPAVDNPMAAFEPLPAIFPATWCFVCFSARLASPQSVPAATKEECECQASDEPADMRHVGDPALVGRFGRCCDRAKAAEKLQHNP